MGDDYGRCSSVGKHLVEPWCRSECEGRLVLFGKSQRDGQTRSSFDSPQDLEEEFGWLRMHQRERICRAICKECMALFVKYRCVRGSTDRHLPCISMVNVHCRVYGGARLQLARFTMVWPYVCGIYKTITTRASMIELWHWQQKYCASIVASKCSYSIGVECTCYAPCCHRLSDSLPWLRQSKCVVRSSNVLSDHRMYCLEGL